MKSKSSKFSFGIMPKVLVILLTLSLIPLMIVGYSTIKDTITLGKKIVEDNAALGSFVSQNSSQALEDQAGIYLQQMANDKARQNNMFFEACLTCAINVSTTFTIFNNEKDYYSYLNHLLLAYRRSNSSSKKRA